MILVGCSTPPRVLVKTEFINILPPATLIQNVTPPIWEGGDNKQLTEYIIQLQSVILQSNNDKRLLREFNDGRASTKN